jgi:mRNA-degrading endonuclease RelE of RelBE toxin-antitoxin system
VSRFTAEYRRRVGACRGLYNVDDQRKKVVFLKLAKRDEQRGAA